MKKYQGFTLIELMITISIMAILATIAISAFGTFQTNNRDQTRLRNLGVIKQALELYRSDNFAYPTVAAFTLSCSSSTLTSPDGSKTYLNQIVRDPKCDSDSRTYIYQPFNSVWDTCSGADCVNFVLCARSEGVALSGQPDKCSTLNCLGSNPCNIGVSSD